MNFIKLSLFYFILCLVSCSGTEDAPKSDTQPVDSSTDRSVKQEQENKEERIISLNGTLTELLYLLDYSDQLVGVDVTSTFPEEVNKLPKLGHVRQLNPESILAMKPTTIFVDANSAQSKAIEMIKESGVKLVVVDMENSLENSEKAATQILKTLGKESEATAKLAELKEKVRKNKEELTAIKSAMTTSPKVLFIYARGAKQLMVAGKNTFAESMITLAGGQNVITEFESFQALSPEALLANPPDIILMFDSGLASLADEGGEREAALGALLQLPAMAETPAGKNKRIITMDGLYLSGFGPRSSDAALELATQMKELMSN
ncbi:MAG: ABC transporter substrate-binding protein [Saprospiraceae bacterium]|nr:ABC transporter substrate-binding protein [Saprospiraceae bacterium]